MESSFKSKNNVEKATIVKSFKFGASKDADSMHLELVLSDLVNMVMEEDLVVKKNALESLNAIVHNHPNSWRGKDDVEMMLKYTL
jgi:hypothetical protein